MNRERGEYSAKTYRANAKYVHKPQGYKIFNERGTQENQRRNNNNHYGKEIERPRNLGNGNNKSICVLNEDNLNKETETEGIVTEHDYSHIEHIQNNEELEHSICTVCECACIDSN